MHLRYDPVVADERRHNDGRREAAFDLELSSLTSEEIAEEIADSVCPAELRDAYVALADASSALDFILYRHALTGKTAALIRHLAATAKVAARQAKDAATLLAEKRMEVGE